jgi:hypothetical protein|tara:strand:+ start:23238 stop:23519 length:282 start_codon:yes stop_codon:yes gene_type:complete
MSELLEKDLCKLTILEEKEPEENKEFFSFFTRFYFKRKEKKKNQTRNYIRELEEKNAYYEIRCNELEVENRYLLAKHDLLYRRLSLLYEFIYE